MGCTLVVVLWLPEVGLKWCIQYLVARVNDANDWGADYFISLHTNASEIRAASGSEAYIYRRDSPAEDLALQILRRLNEATGLRDRGVMARPSLYVLRKTRMPAVLVELGFITNSRDAAQQVL